MLEPAAESEIDKPSAGRLVIRIKLIPQEPQAHDRRRLSGRVLVILGAVAVVAGWLGIKTFSAPDSPPPPPAAVVSETPRAVEPEVQQPPPDAPTSPINEVIPDVPRSALNTIRGTVRVSIRVMLDKQGSVVAATTDDAGPSRYFERLAVEAAKQWTFTAVNLQDQRTMLVRFNFTRAGVTADASPVQ